MRFLLHALAWPFRACFSARWVAFVPIFALTFMGLAGFAFYGAMDLMWRYEPWPWSLTALGYVGLAAFWLFLVGVPFFGLLMLVGGLWSATGSRGHAGGWAVAILGPLAAAVLWFGCYITVVIAALILSRLPDGFGKRQPFPETMPLYVAAEGPDGLDSQAETFLADRLGPEAAAARLRFDAPGDSLRVSLSQSPGIYLFDAHFGRPVTLTLTSDPGGRVLSGWDNKPLPEGTTELTLYEGDWGDYYGVRVTIRPAEGGDPLLQRTYLLDGWMH